MAAWGNGVFEDESRPLPNGTTLRLMCVISTKKIMSSSCPIGNMLRSKINELRQAHTCYQRRDSLSLCKGALHGEGNFITVFCSKVSSRHRAGEADY
jgi:hypothetical protein